MLPALHEKKKILLGCLLLLLLLAMVLQPALAYQAAGKGLQLWWKVVAPALLPFFIISELLLELGVVSYLGPFLSRLMRPLFNLPGSGALAVAMGFCSGFPSGSAITAGLWMEKTVTTAQGERLIAFTNNAGPLYITVSVATGLLGWPGAALVLVLSHYGADLLLGVALGFWSRLRGEQTVGVSSHPGESVQLYTELSFGSRLRNAAQRAFGNILLIGCYMVFFSVLTALLAAVLPPLPPLLHSWLLGVFEMSLGVDLLAQSGLPLSQILPWTAAMVSFGGLSVQAQVLAMIAGTEIRPRLYLLCRPLQAGLAFLLAWLLCRVLVVPTATFSISAQPRPLSLLAASSLLALSVTGALLGLALWYRRKDNRLRT